MLPPKFFQSMKHHQLKLHHGAALLVTVTGGKTKRRYPINGVVVMFEQTTTLEINQAVFHELQEDGSLGAPCTIRDVKFVYPMVRS